VMAILVILISLDFLDESVGSSPSRIILFDYILAEIPAETPTIPFVIPTLPHTSLFLYTDSSDSDTSERPPSQDPYEVTVAQWRSRLIPLGHLASRYPPDHSSPDHFSSDDSSSDYSSDSSLGALSLVRVDLLPPHKRIRGAIIASNYDDSTEESYEAYTKPDIDSDVQADIDANTVVVDAASAREADVGVEVAIESDVKDEAEEEAESRDRCTIEIGVDRVLDIKSAQESRGVGCWLLVSKGPEELKQMRVSRYYDRAEFRRMIPTATRIGMTPVVIEERIERRMAEALEVYEVNRNCGPTMESGDKREDDNGDDNGNGNGNGGGNGNRDGPGGENRYGNHNVNVGGVVPVARECTYQYFLKCQPLIFKGNEGVVGLTRWFEKMETLLHISNCPHKYKVKYALCTLQNGALMMCCRVGSII
ncbi:hypothetical protein Tco_1024873, partial [Tanacetum coccineum]